MNKSDDLKSPLYKYRRFEARTLSMFIDRELYFASPEKLNDPYDCQILISESIQEAVRIVQDSHPKSLNLAQINLLKDLMSTAPEIESNFRSKGILSFSNTSECVLMWTHYADEHMGLCVGFRRSSNFLNSKEKGKNLSAINCRYFLKNPFVDKLVEVITVGKMMPLKLLCQQLKSIGLAAKHRSWKYEREVRIVRNKPGVERFDPQELVEIIFGAKMDKEKIKTLLNLLSSKEWAHVKYFVMTKYAESFHLKKVPVSTPDIEYIRQGRFEMTSIF